jgi:toxin ParE1/3/4
MAWQTTDEAEYDLQFIAEQGVVQFGPHVSRAYVARLIEMFGMISDHPQMGAERQAESGSVRLMPCGSHHILYVVDNEDVIILRVLHGLQNWFDLL